MPPIHPAVMERSGAAFAGTANLNMAYGAESGVDAMPPTAAGFHDVFGNLWQVGRRGSLARGQLRLLPLLACCCVFLDTSGWKLRPEPLTWRGKPGAEVCSRGVPDHGH